MVKPKLTKVLLSSDVFAVCVQHALSTERQEIMGLLIGYIDEETYVSHISASLILHRSDKKPDRVEISPEQLSEASSYAEQLATTLNKPMRVVGWYHSHPHITVLPSHVDIRTQAAYQLMDPLFIGLIFSVYLRDSKLSTNQVQLSCFQSSNTDRIDIPLLFQYQEMQTHNLQSMLTLPKIIIQEEVESFNSNTQENDDALTQLHNEAVKTVSLTNIIYNLQLPLLNAMQDRLNANKDRIRLLQELKAEQQAERQRQKKTSKNLKSPESHEKHEDDGLVQEKDKKLTVGSFKEDTQKQTKRSKSREKENKTESMEPKKLDTPQRNVGRKGKKRSYKK